MYRQPETADEIRNRIEILSSLVRHPGWMLYQAFMEREVSETLKAVLIAPDPHAQATRVGGLKALKAVEDWATREAKYLEASLSDYTQQ